MKRILLIVLSSVLALSFSPHYQIASGHAGEHSNGTQTLRHIGPYLIAIAPDNIRPYIGDHIIIATVLDGATNTPISHARVLIKTHNKTTQEEGWAIALNSPVTPQWFKASVSLDTPGIWALRVEIESDLGLITVPLPNVTINSPERQLGGSIIYGLVLLTIIGVVIYLWRSTKRLSNSQTMPR